VRLKVRRARLWNESYLTYRYMWPNLEAAVREAKQNLPSGARRVLDIGCGHKPYADLFADCQHIGLNNTTQDASPDLVADAMRLPIASQSIDLVFCTQVLEHVARPWILLNECFRVLRPGGWLVLSAPCYWPLHEEPYDFYRYTRYGLERLVRDAGFASCRVMSDGGDYARLFLSLIHALPRVVRLPFRLPLNVLGVLLDKASYRTTLPANYTVLARMPWEAQPGGGSQS
jgi:SAM-dependent methyltransferase